jgi:hypothetical protein
MWIKEGSKTKRRRDEEKVAGFAETSTRTRLYETMRRHVLENSSHREAVESV